MKKALKSLSYSIPFARPVQDMAGPMKSAGKCLRGRPAIRKIVGMYLVGLLVSLWVFFVLGKPAASGVMVLWGLGMFAHLCKRWEADSDERQAVYALSTVAVVLGTAGLMGVV